MMFSPTEEILELIADGKPFLLVDSEDRENEADLIIPAQFITKEIINFMITHCRGLICTPITSSLAKRLELDLMKRRNTKNSAFFTTSIEAKNNVTTGISAADRAKTIKLLTEDNITADHFVTPGHVFPLIINAGGLKARQGHTEGAATLAWLAGLKPTTTICEVLDDNGDSAKLPFLSEFIKKHNLKITTIKDLLRYLDEKQLNITF